MLDFAGLVPPVEDVAEATGKDVVVAVAGADVLTTLHATVLVVVLEEAVGAAEVTVCCDCTGAEAPTGTVATGVTFDGGVAVVMVEF